MMKSSIAKLKISTIEDHNLDQNTDKLYDPLRKIIMNPESVTEHELQSPRAATKSIIHDRYAKLTKVEMAMLKRDIFIPVQQQLIPSEDVSKVDQIHYRIIDACQKVSGPLLTRQEVQSAIKNKKDSRIVYQLVDRVDNMGDNNNVSELLKYNKSNPNLRSQILAGEIKGLSRNPSNLQANKELNRYKSESNLPLPTYEEINKWLSFRERQSIRKMRESQINPEAKGYIYQYNITQKGAEVKTKLNRYPSHGNIRGSTIIDPVPIPFTKVQDSAPCSPLGKQTKNISTSFIANPENTVLQREYYNNAPLPMAYQTQNVPAQESHFVNRGQISVDQRFETPNKLRTQPKFKELPSTAMKSIDQGKQQNVNYTYKVQQINDDKNVGCGGFCNGE